MINTLFLPELRELLATDNAAELKEFTAALHPVTTAEFMEGLTPAEIWRVLLHADVGVRATVFNYLPEPTQVEICETEEHPQIAELISNLASDDRVDLIQQLQPETQAALLQLMPSTDRREIQRLSQYPEGSAGAIMSTDVAKIHENSTVRTALEELGRQAETFETIYYLYVVDADNHLRGVVTARQLLAAMRRPQLTMADLMESKLITVEAMEDQEEVANRVARLDLLAIPVVDQQRHLLGIITHDDVIDVVHDEAIEDAQRIAGVEPLDDRYLQTHWWTLSWKRGIWLTILFFAALLTAVALKAYDRYLEAWHWLIPFIPLVISSGGNTGNQSATLIITALTRKHITLRDWWSVACREMIIGTILGIALGLFGLVVAQFFPDVPGVYQSLVVPITLLAVVMAGTLIGSMLPLLFLRMGFDPALMSNPFVAGIVDILGIVIYMNVAFWMLT